MTATNKNELSSLAKAIPLFATNYRSFTKSDFILANFIAQNYQDFLHMTILDLAKATSLSEITISRFCKKLSLAGVQALKIQLSYLISEEIKIIAASLPDVNLEQHVPNGSRQHQGLPNTPRANIAATSNAPAKPHANGNGNSNGTTNSAQPHNTTGYDPLAAATTAATGAANSTVNNTGYTAYEAYDAYRVTGNDPNTSYQSPHAHAYNQSIVNGATTLNPALAPNGLAASSSDEAANMGAVLGAQLKTFTLEDSLHNIGTQIFATLTAGLNQTLNLIDFDAVERATNIINNSSRLMLFGYGNSSVVCKDLGTRFVRFGFSCEIVSDMHQQITLASVCDANTTIIVVSYTGSSLHLDDVLKIARQRGAKVILFTSYKNSAIAKQADAVLIGVCPELKNNTEASLSRLIYMAIGDIIYTRLTLLRNTQYHDNLQQIRSSLAILKS